MRIRKHKKYIKTNSATESVRQGTANRINVSRLLYDIALKKYEDGYSIKTRSFTVAEAVSEAAKDGVNVTLDLAYFNYWRWSEGNDCRYPERNRYQMLALTRNRKNAVFILNPEGIWTGHSSNSLHKVRFDLVSKAVFINKKY